MPLKTKRPSPRLKTAKHTGKVTSTHSKKTVSSLTKASGKTTAVGKKLMRKAQRTTAGYELYSSDSEEHMTAHRPPWQHELPAPVTTLVEEWMARQADESTQLKNLSKPEHSQPPGMQRRGGGHSDHIPSQTPFNKRLVSSTPDPELLQENEEQLIPERDGSHREALAVSDLASLQVGGQGQVILTETQREQLRQQIDAVLLEEAQEVQRLQKLNTPPQTVQQKPQAYQVPQLKPLPQETYHTGYLPQTAMLEHSGSREGTSVETHLRHSAPPAHQRGVLQESKVPQKTTAAQASVKSTRHDIMSENGLQNRGSDIGVFHHFLHRDSAHGLPPSFLQGGAEDGNDVECQVFVPKVAAGVASNISMGFVPVGEQTATFNPLLSGVSASLSRQGKPTSKGFQPLAVTTENEVASGDQGDGCRSRTVTWQMDQGHQATPACSPIPQKSQGFSGALHASKTNQKVTQNFQRQGGKSLPSGRVGNRIERVVERELQTPATSPEEAVSRPGLQRVATKKDVQQRHDVTPKSSARGSQASSSRAIRGRGTQENVPNSSNQGKLQKGSGKGVKSSDKSQKQPLRNSKDNYTSDGYYINGSVDVHEDPGGVESPPEPRSFQPTPMQSPKLPPPNIQDSLELPVLHLEQGPPNTNNNSDTYLDQRDAEHSSWMHTRRGPMLIMSATRGNPSHSVPDCLAQLRPAREGMAEADFTSLPLSVARAMMMMAAEDQDGDDQDPPAPAPTPMPASFRNREMLSGPRMLRHLLSELKQICAIDGDMEVGQLLQEVIDLVEIMPQLKVTFNLQAEIDLALQPLRTENSQLRRRLRILNQQLKERERREKEDTNPGMNFEMLHLQTENASLQRQLKEEREGCKKLSQYISVQQQQLEKASKEIQLIHCKLQEREHDKLLVRQEYTQDLNRLHQEIEMMSRRNESVQLKLSSADRENNILQLNLKQRDLEISRLHTVLGNLKQGVTEVLQYFDQSVGDLNTTDAGMRKLLAFLKTSSQAYNPPKEDLLSRSSDQEPLQRSGNQRVKHPLRTDKDHAQEQVADLRDSSRQDHDSGRHDRDSGRHDQNSCAHDQSGRHGSASSLTVAALEAHNRHLKPVKDKAENFLTQENFSYHSWDGVDLHSSFVGNKSQLYHSDPESMASPHKKGAKSGHQHHHHHHQRHDPPQQTQEMGKKRQHLAPSESRDYNQSHLSLRNTETDKMHVTGGRADDETLVTLSEMPISEAEKAKANELHLSLGMTDTTRHSVTDYFKRYPGSKPTEARSSSPLPLNSSMTADDSTAVDLGHSSLGEKSIPKEESPPISSPNTSHSHSTTDIMQRGYFHGTELDLSLSTIQEDAFSSVTGTTLASVGTAMSLDDRAFREGIATLDENIAKVHEALQRTKKMFS